MNELAERGAEVGVLPGRVEQSPQGTSAFREPPGLASTSRGYRLRRTLFAGDLLALALAIAAATAAFSLAGQPSWGVGEVIAIAASLPFFFLLAHGAGLYHLSERHIDYSLAEEAGPVFMVVSVWLWLLLVLLSLAVDGPVAMRWFFLAWGGSIALILLGRTLIRRVTHSRPWYRQNVLLLGDSRGIDQVLRRIYRHPECGLDPVGSLRRVDRVASASAIGDGPGAKRMEETIADTGPIVSGPSEVAEFVREAGIQRVIVTEWAADLGERTELIRHLATSGVFVDMVSGEPEALCAGATVHHLEGLPMMTVQPTTMTRTSFAVKRALDIIIAGVVLLLVSPLLVFAAIRVKLGSSGPAFFRQQRAGRHGRSFEMLKLRTMVSDAEEQHDAMRAAQGLDNLIKLRADPRITKAGAWLRRTSIDELPQLWNVLRGDMSLVGPRPLPLDEAPLARDHFADRLQLRPGITGPWQIYGRSDIPFEDMVKLDYTYVTSWSLQEDLRLLIKTASAVVSGRGAY